ncbi:MAG: polyphosphate kinase 1 [Helicobacteraceae bacterium]|jgi:polyphosphate kinase|nr:polyphosphate kinase 1 [Helicobacteraceae bacterium]
MTRHLQPQHFVNREISWLRFNTRVLEEASNPRNPPLEQLKYIAIYGTNLDEFYMIRVAGLKAMEKARVSPGGPDGLGAYEQLALIRDYISKETQVLEKRTSELFAILEKNGIKIKGYGDLNPTQKRKANGYFESHIYPVVIPIAVDATHPFPHLNNLSFAMAVKLKAGENEPIRYGLIRLPRVLPRFVEIDAETFTPIESIVYHHIEDMFSGFTPISHAPFRVTRNADISIEEEEADDFLDVLEEGLRLRQKGEIVRLEIAQSCDPDLQEFLTAHLKVNHNDIYTRTTPLNLGAYWQLIGNKRFTHLLLEAQPPRNLSPFDLKEPIANVIDKQDAIVLLPFESFNPVERFISEAANDPNVLSIRMTLYRVGSNSPIVKALIEAAEAGKMVTAVVELKARFDEENNLKWARALENAGAHVIYGVVGLKIHAKIAHVIRREAGGDLKHFVHLSTGNYNSGTARIYTDVSFFTANAKIGEDAVRFFHHITGFAKNTELHSLAMAPTQIKPRLLELIAAEAKMKGEGEIIAKINSLVDKDVIVALYRASQAGAKISLIIRGICCLLPGVEGVSDNIRVVSLVGKYLEHGRILYFKHSEPQVFFSSADWMPRNLTRRIELMTPVYDAEIARLLTAALRLQLGDALQAKALRKDGSYSLVNYNSKDSKDAGYDAQSVIEAIVARLHKDGEPHNKIAPAIEEFLKKHSE